jgi:hypothetical protein
MAQSSFTAIDHVQLAMPPGEVQAAVPLIQGCSEMTEIPKPPELARRGGCWVERVG